MKTCTHFIDAEIVDGFWKPILDANRVAGLRTIYEQMETTGRIDALRILWKPDGEAPKPHRFWDSDIAKWIEAAAYAVGQKYDAELDQQIQHLIHLLEEQQQPDGYLNSYYLAVVEPEKRFTNSLMVILILTTWPSSNRKNGLQIFSGAMSCTARAI